LIPVEKRERKRKKKVLRYQSQKKELRSLNQNKVKWLGVKSCE
jgi:hypothetical protein